MLEKVNHIETLLDMLLDDLSKIKDHHIQLGLDHKGDVPRYYRSSLPDGVSKEDITRKRIMLGQELMKLDKFLRTYEYWKENGDE